MEEKMTNKPTHITKVEQINDFVLFTDENGNIQCKHKEEYMEAQQYTFDDKDRNKPVLITKEKVEAMRQAKMRLKAHQQDSLTKRGSEMAKKDGLAKLLNILFVVAFLVAFFSIIVFGLSAESSVEAITDEQLLMEYGIE